MSTHRRALLFALLALLLPASAAHAELVKLVVHTRQPYAGGVSFGDTGPYEIIAGVAYFAIDPKDKHNRVIVDLDRAPGTPRARLSSRRTCTSWPRRI